MRRSIVFALLIVLGVAGWMMSGIWSAGENRGDANTADLTVGKEVAERLVPLPRVRIRDIEAELVPERIVLLGATEAKRKVRLRAQTAAVVAEIFVSRGQIVQKGDLLLRLATDDRLARLHHAKALLKQRRTEFEAASSLSEKNLRSRIALSGTEAQLKAARASLEEIQVDIDRTYIRAPFDGVVDERFVELGDYMKIGEPVATILDLSTIIVAGEVSEHNVSKIKNGLLGQAVLVDKRELEGQISFVARSSNSSTRTFRVELEVSNPGYAVSEGITAKITLSVGETMAHRLSPAVLTLNDDGVLGIKVVNTDNIVEFIPVSLVADTPDGTWLGGLPDKIRLITVGHAFVRVGQKVQAVPEDKLGS